MYAFHSFIIRVAVTFFLSQVLHGNPSPGILTFQLSLMAVELRTSGSFISMTLPDIFCRTTFKAKGGDGGNTLSPRLSRKMDEIQPLNNK